MSKKAPPFCRDCRHRFREDYCNRDEYREVDLVTGLSNVKGLRNCALERSDSFFLKFISRGRCGKEGRYFAGTDEFHTNQKKAKVSQVREVVIYDVPHNEDEDPEQLLIMNEQRDLWVNSVEERDVIS